jgi:hypothetical protein
MSTKMYKAGITTPETALEAQNPQEGAVRKKKIKKYTKGA